MSFIEDSCQTSPRLVPRLFVSLSLPEICTFSSPDPPLLTVSLTTDSDQPVTIRQWLPSTDYTCFTLRTFSRYEIETSEKLYEYRWDVCARRPLTPPSLVDETSYITIPPDGSHVLVLPFRNEYSTPHGDKGPQGCDVDARIQRFRWAIENAMGMGSMKIGSEYVVRLKDGLKTCWWKYGTREELAVIEAREDDDLDADGEALLLEGQNEVRLKVEA